MRLVWILLLTAAWSGAVAAATATTTAEHRPQRAASSSPSLRAAALPLPSSPTDCGNSAPSPTPPVPPPAPGHADPASQLIITCGANLTGRSVSDLAVGACVRERSSSDPRVFGPDAWRTLHRFAANFPDAPTPAVSAACAAFLTSLPLMLPCSRCGADLAAFLRANEQHAGSFHPACRPQRAWGGKCTDLKTTCASREALVSFFLRAHDNVNRWVQPCREPWTPRRADAAYGLAHGFCAGTIVVGETALCRWAGDTDCVQPVAAA
jgi:hypothetical protein